MQMSRWRACTRFVVLSEVDLCILIYSLCLLTSLTAWKQLFCNLELIQVGAFMRTHVLQTYVHQIYDKSDAVTTFATVMNYQICDAHSAASYMCIVHLSCGKYMCEGFFCVCVCTTFCCCWRQYLLVRRRFFWKHEILSNRIKCILYFVQCLSRRACLSYPYVHFFLLRLIYNS